MCIQLHCIYLPRCLTLLDEYNIWIDYIHQEEITTYCWTLWLFPVASHISWCLLTFCRVCCCAQSLHNASGTSHVLQKWVCFFFKFLRRHGSQNSTFSSFLFWLKKNPQTSIICYAIGHHFPKKKTTKYSLKFAFIFKNAYQFIQLAKLLSLVKIILSHIHVLYTCILKKIDF